MAQKNFIFNVYGLYSISVVPGLYSISVVPGLQKQRDQNVEGQINNQRDHNLLYPELSDLVVLLYSLIL